MKNGIPERSVLRTAFLWDWFAEMGVNFNQYPPEGYNEAFLVQLLRNRRINTVNQYHELVQNPHYQLYQEHERLFKQNPQNQANIDALMNNYQANLSHLHFDLGTQFQLLNVSVIQLAPTLCTNNVESAQIDALITREILLMTVRAFETVEGLLDNPLDIDVFAHG